MDIHTSAAEAGLWSRIRKEQEKQRNRSVKTDENASFMSRNSEDALWLKRGRKNGRVWTARTQGGAWGPLTVPASSRSWQTGPRSAEESWHRSRKVHGFDCGGDMLSLLSSPIIHPLSPLTVKAGCAVSRHKIPCWNLWQRLILYFSMTLIPIASPTSLDASITEAPFNSRRIVPPHLKTNTL